MTELGVARPKETIETSVLKERVNRTMEVLEQELLSVVSPQEARLRITNMRDRIVFANRKQFDGFYYEQYHSDWDKTTQAFVYEPRRDYGRETERLVVILDSDLMVTPEVIQVVAHEGIHFCGLPTVVTKLEPWELEEISPDDYYQVSTIMLEEWLGPVYTKSKDFFYPNCLRANIEKEVKSGSALRTYRTVEANVPLETVDEEVQMWESATDWLALEITRKINPGYEPKTGYIGRGVFEKYAEISKERGLEEEYRRVLKMALFQGERDGVESVLDRLGTTYLSCREEVISK